MADKWWRLENREGAAEAIRGMGEEDLRFLNRLIVDRLNLIAQARSTALLARFSVGDSVTSRPRTDRERRRYSQAQQEDRDPANP